VVVDGGRRGAGVGEVLELAIWMMWKQKEGSGRKVYG